MEMDIETALEVALAENSYITAYQVSETYLIDEKKAYELLNKVKAKMGMFSQKSHDDSIKRSATRDVLKIIDLLLSGEVLTVDDIACHKKCTHRNASFVFNTIASFKFNKISIGKYKNQDNKSVISASII